MKRLILILAVSGVFFIGDPDLTGAFDHGRHRLVADGRRGDGGRNIELRLGGGDVGILHAARAQ